MRPLLLGLLGLLLLLQYRLWLGEGGIRERQGLEAQVRVGEEGNQLLRERNDALARQVLELQEGDEMLEAVALRSSDWFGKERSLFFLLMMTPKRSRREQ